MASIRIEYIARGRNAGLKAVLHVEDEHFTLGRADLINSDLHTVGLERFRARYRLVAQNLNIPFEDRT